MLPLLFVCFQNHLALDLLHVFQLDFFLSVPFLQLRLREGHFTAILWHESSAGGVQGWTDFVWSWKIGSGPAQIVWSWKIESGPARIVWSWTIGIFASSAISLPPKIRSGQGCIGSKDTVLLDKADCLVVDFY